MDVIGTAGDEGSIGTGRREPPVPPTAATSLTVPQLPQSGQRPTHFAATC